MSKTKVKVNYKMPVVLRGYVVVEARSKAEANDIADSLCCDLDELWGGFTPEDGESVSIGSPEPTTEKATI